MDDLKKPPTNDQRYHIDAVKLVAICFIGLVIVLGQRKLISEEFVVYGCVGAVALAAGHLLLKHLI